MPSRIIAIALAAIVARTTTAFALDPSLPTYEVVSGLSGQLKSVGSNTLIHEIELWADAFKSKYPGVAVVIEGKGSATAPPALLDGSAQLGPMSRLMTSAEADAFEKKYGYKATLVRVAIDALAIYVNKENPIECLTLQQLDQIFSKSREGLDDKSINAWGEAGLNGEWKTKPISLYGRNNISGTYEFFRELLYSGSFKQAVRPQVDSESLVQQVANDRFAIGYSGIGYRTAGVRTVPVAAMPGEPCYDTSPENTYSGKYPIARYLYVYLNKKPGEPLDALRGQFIKFILSKDGQTLTEKGGYYAITAATREAELNKLGLLASAK